MKKKIIKEITGWILALLCSVTILNIFTFAYFHPVHELRRPGGSTPGVIVPHQWGLYGDEGWRIQTIDSFGYPNRELTRAEEYYCVIGSSHTEGFRSFGKRYSDILNDRFSDGKSLRFYNIAKSGYYFTEIAKHFSGIVQEFPDMSGLIIEIDSTDSTAEALNSSLEQIGYNSETDSAKSIMSKLTKKNQAVIAFKNYVPFVRVLSNQVATYRKYKDTGEYTSSEKVNDEVIDTIEYRVALDRVMSMMREKYHGDIVIVYHPKTTLDVDGTLNVESCYTDTIFEKVCKEHSIVFINMKDDFVKEFNENNHAVYGFDNTMLMTGHINQYGHSLIAERLSDYYVERHRK